MAFGPARRPVAALLLAAAAGAPQSPPTGCLWPGFRFTPALHPPGALHNVSGPMHCQSLCQSSTSYKFFGYFPNTKTCYLGGSSSELVEDSSAVAGPCNCEGSESACESELPSGFPGLSASATNSLFQTSFAPTKLQCWPHDAAMRPEPCDLEPVTVLDELDSGWQASCEGLAEVPLQSGETCEANCRRNASCASWRAEAVCLQGLGRSCEGPAGATGSTAVGAQRIMHGHYRVLLDLAGVEVTRLQNVFDKGYIANVSDALLTCRKYCLASLQCEVWEYSTVSGCWVEDAAVQEIDWPLTAASFLRDTALAESVIAGEYIQRLCGPPASAAPGVPAPAPPLGGTPALAPLDAPAPAPPGAPAPLSAWPVATPALAPTTPTTTPAGGGNESSFALANATAEALEGVMLGASDHVQTYWIVYLLGAVAVFACLLFECYFCRKRRKLKPKSKTRSLRTYSRTDVEAETEDEGHNALDRETLPLMVGDGVSSLDVSQISPSSISMASQGGPLPSLPALGAGPLGRGCGGVPGSSRGLSPPAGLLAARPWASWALPSAGVPAGRTAVVPTSPTTALVPTATLPNRGGSWILQAVPLPRYAAGL